jgi:hypothetical protein
MYKCTCFSSNFTSSVIFGIIRSKAKIFKFDVNLSIIKRDDFFRANVNNLTFYTEQASLFINSVEALQELQHTFETFLSTLAVLNLFLIYTPNNGPHFTLYTMYSKDALLDRE